MSILKNGVEVRRITLNATDLRGPSVDIGGQDSHYIRAGSYFNEDVSVFIPSFNEQNTTNVFSYKIDYHNARDYEMQQINKYPLIVEMFALELKR
ncbi:MAG: hypothetical protein Q4D05_08430 [Acinetobacter sp.]|nr:hypothetical protein [Acinetobacter sp.]